MLAAYVNSGHIQWLILISFKHEDCSQMKALLNVSSKWQQTSCYFVCLFVLFTPVSEGVKYSDHFLHLHLSVLHAVRFLSRGGE